MHRGRVRHASALHRRINVRFERDSSEQSGISACLATMQRCCLPIALLAVVLPSEPCFAIKTHDHLLVTRSDHNRIMKALYRPLGRIA
jgi:hypothetical protein